MCVREDEKPRGFPHAVKDACLYYGPFLALTPIWGVKNFGGASIFLSLYILSILIILDMQVSN